MSLWIEISKINIMIFILFFSMFVQSEIKCPNNRVLISTPCYGECGSFIDENSNAICDIWEKYNESRNNKKITIEKNIKTQDIVVDNLLESTTKETLDIIEAKEKKKTNKITRYGFIYIFVVNLFLIIFSEIFKKDIGFNFIRKFWNWVLLISMLFCILCGFFLYFDLLKEQRNLLYQLHIQTGLISSLCAVYHIIKRYNCL